MINRDELDRAVRKYVEQYADHPIGYLQPTEPEPPCPYAILYPINYQPSEHSSWHDPEECYEVMYQFTIVGSDRQVAGLSSKINAIITQRGPSGEYYHDIPVPVGIITWRYTYQLGDPRRTAEDLYEVADSYRLYVETRNNA